MARVVCVDQGGRFEIGSILTGASARNKQMRDIEFILTLIYGLAYAKCTCKRIDVKCDWFRKSCMPQIPLVASKIIRKTVNLDIPSRYN